MPNYSTRRMKTNKKYHPPSYPQDTLVTHKRVLPQGKTILQRQHINPKTLTPQTLTVVPKHMPLSLGSMPITEIKWRYGGTQGQKAANTRMMRKRAMGGWGQTPNTTVPATYLPPPTLEDQIDWAITKVAARKTGRGPVQGPLPLRGRPPKGMSMAARQMALFNQQQQMAQNAQLMQILPQNAMSMFYGQAMPLVVMAYAAKELKKQAAKNRRNQQLVEQGLLPDSSWIVNLDYDPNTEEATMWTKKHMYVFHGVHPEIFIKWSQGKASCTTDDDTGRMRWWILKTPSLGAFFNQNILNRFKFDKVY